MKFSHLCIWIILLYGGCNQMNQEENFKRKYLSEAIPENRPLFFKPQLSAGDELIHRGVFSPDLSHYFFTVSDPQFSHFDVKFIKKIEGRWSAPAIAFFNSSYNEHGHSFSPDGNTLYFSSTRPTNIEGVVETWHLWRCKQINGEWSEPTYVDIPNLRDKLTSHPSISNDGTLYFHSSNADYSHMEIYYSTEINGRFQHAKKATLPIATKTGTCTPYIDVNGQFLIYATIGDQLDLHISIRNKEEKWGQAMKLPRSINHNGQGNPYITPDGKFLFFASNDEKDSNSWHMNWVSTEGFIK